MENHRRRYFIFIIQIFFLSPYYLEVSSSAAPPSLDELQLPQNSIFDEIEKERAFANVLPDSTLRLLHWSKRGYQIEVILRPVSSKAVARQMQRTPTSLVDPIRHTIS